jgi:hypothetical protein
MATPTLADYAAKVANYTDDQLVYILHSSWDKVDDAIFDVLLAEFKRRGAPRVAEGGGVAPLINNRYPYPHF